LRTLVVFFLLGVSAFTQQSTFVDRPLVYSFAAMRIHCLFSFILLAGIVGAQSPPASTVAGKKIMLVVAHPDDETLFGPVLSKYRAQKAEVTIVYIADGGKGFSRLPSLPAGKTLADVRKLEAECAAQVVGAEPVFLGFEDAALGAKVMPPWKILNEATEKVAEVFQRVQPDVVLTFGPDGAYGHPDHRLAGDVITSLFQRQRYAWHPRLYFMRLNSENVRKLGDHAPVPWQGVDPAYLPVNIAYLDADFAVNQRATACHRSQFAPDELESDAAMLHLLWNGKISFRPFASLPSRSDDLFD
jgi:LmbE family N-acetylglucosaminyl deacetylase